MNDFRKLLALSAIGCIALGVALAGAIILGIWTGFENELFSKCIGTLVVLFVLCGLLHSVAKGMCEKPKDKS